MKSSTKFKTVDDYISSAPAQVKKILNAIRKAMKEAAPRAEEVISYNMPALRANGILVYYASFKTHIGFYPTPSAIERFKNELSQYESAKGSVKFPLDEPIPLKLIQTIVKFRVKEDSKK